MSDDANRDPRLLLLAAPGLLRAQGLVRGVEEDAKAGNKAAGPVGVPSGNNGGVRGPVQSDQRNSSDKQAKAAKSKTGSHVAQQAAPVQLTAEQIVATSDANIARIKDKLNLTSAQQKNWASFNSAMHYFGHNGAERFLNDRAVDQRMSPTPAERLLSLDGKQKAVFIEEMVRLSRERGLD